MIRPADLAAALGKALPAVRQSESDVDRIAYARDLWPRHHLAVADGRIAEHCPAVIVWPGTAEEVAAVVGFCAGEGVPIAPFGAGSGVCGGILPDDTTVVLDLKRLNRRRALDRDGPLLEVEAGALGIRLEEDLEAEGFTIGHFPSSILCSTVGGWVAGRGAGQCSGRYGKIEDMVAGLECVVGRGELVRFQRRTHGPDLLPLFIGSEGTLGVITSATLRLHPLPDRTFGGFSFPTMEAGWSAMREMFQSGLRPAVSRLYDPFDSFLARVGSAGRARRAARGGGGQRSQHADTGKHPRAPGAGGIAIRTLLRSPQVVNDIVERFGHSVLRGSRLVLIFEGPLAEGAEDMARAQTIAERLGARSLGEEPARHWLAHRYSVSYRQAPMFMAGAFADTMEVAAPWSRLGALYEAVRSAFAPYVFVMAHLSHAYPDGCSIYFTFAGTAATVAEAEAKYDAAWRAGLDAAIGAGGTLSHHHGVGRSKAPKLGGELGLGVEVIRALRGVFDPAGVMNPGNLLPRDAPVRRAVAAAPAVPVVDRESQLVHAAGSATLAEVEAVLAKEGWSLGLGAGAPAMETSVAAWIAAGGYGAADPWLDPVDHLVAGFTARLRDGGELEVRRSPRRAVGPDLWALFLGMQERAGVITAVWLRAHGARRARELATGVVRDPPIEAAEEAWVERAVAEAGRTGSGAEPG